MVPTRSPFRSSPATEEIRASNIPESCPNYRTAYELELWRRAEEEKVKAALIEQEEFLKVRLEEEYRMREESRHKEFQKRQAELRDVEAKVRRKLQELQQREIALISEEARVSTLNDDYKRRAELAVKEHTEAARQQSAEAQHSLELSRSRTASLEDRITELQADVDAARARLEELATRLEEQQRQQQETSPEAEVRQELQSLRLRIREQQVRAEALAASRDHFRGKVEDLCRRLLGTSNDIKPQSPNKEAVFGAPLSDSQFTVDVASGTSVADALRKVQEDLAQLAQTWETAESKSNGPRGNQGHEISDAQASRAAPAQTPSDIGKSQSQEDTHQLERYLAWLRTQRDELIQSGLYGGEDNALVALDKKIADAAARLYGFAT